MERKQRKMLEKKIEKYAPLDFVEYQHLKKRLRKNESHKVYNLTDFTGKVSLEELFYIRVGVARMLEDSIGVDGMHEDIMGDGFNIYFSLFGKDYSLRCELAEKESA